MVSAQMFVREANRIASKEYEEEIYAVNFFKKVDEIKESMALETDLRTWANASAWSLEDDSAVEITEVDYDFDAETIEPGDYKVTFKTEGCPCRSPCSGYRKPLQAPGFLQSRA